MIAMLEVNKGKRNKPKIYIAVYRPHIGNYYHWSLYVASTPPRILEVANSHPEFTANILEIEPEDHSIHFIEKIEVGEIHESHMAEFISVMNDVKVDNETLDWCCQDYVLEALEALATACVLDEDDEIYQKGIRKAKREYFGPD